MKTAHDAVDAYRGDVQARKAIRKRGFTGACATALGSTPKRLGDDRKLRRLERTLNRDIRLVARETASDDLSSCPHQAN